jgi:hypothetical protein
MFSRQQFEDLRDYFLTTPDDQTHIWDFPDGLTSEILVGNQDFGSMTPLGGSLSSIRIEDASRYS